MQSDSLPVVETMFNICLNLSTGITNSYAVNTSFFI